MTAEMKDSKASMVEEFLQEIQPTSGAIDCRSEKENGHAVSFQYPATCAVPSFFS